jgi:hypothetical protein
MRFPLLLSLIFLSGAASAADVPKTTAGFVDICTGNITGVTDPHGRAVLLVTISGAAPEEQLWLDIRVFAQNGQDFGQEQADEQRISKRFRKVPRDGRLQYKKRLVLSGDRKIWNVQVRWFQRPEVRRFGAQTSAILASKDTKRRFYEITGPAVCSWETPVGISSEYRMNQNKAPMTISRETTFEELSESDKGLDLGLMPDGFSTTSKNPLVTVSTENENFGWLFYGWRYAKGSLTQATLTRQWRLAESEGGFFGSRYSFRRFPVLEYRLNQAEHCPKWIPARKGYMDTGRQVTDFYSVPKDISGNSKDAAEFMEKMRPTENSCPMDPTMPAGTAYPVPSSEGTDADDLLFFYPS